MNNIVDSIVDRLREYICADATLTEDYVSNTNPAILKASPAEAKFFDFCWAYKQPPQAIIFEPGTNDPSKIYNVVIKEADMITGAITLTEPLAADIPAGWIIKRAPNWTVVQNVILGEPTAIDAYPAICVVPREYNIEWMTLNSTTEAANVDILVYVIEDNLPNSERSLMRITMDLMDLLNANLKMKVKRPTSGWNRLYYSLCDKANFGHQEKGTAYLKAAQMNWTGHEAWVRFMLQNENPPGVDPFG